MIWRLDHASVTGTARLAQGVLANAGAPQPMHAEPAKPITVAKGDLVRLVVSPGPTHSFDTTNIDFKRREQGGSGRAWNLAKDVTPDPAAGGAGNPHADLLGNPGVWHFAGEWEPGSGPPPSTIPAGSLLATWKALPNDVARRQVAVAVQTLLTAGTGPRGRGRPSELGKVLQPLTDVREKLLFGRGLYNEQALKGKIHSSQTGNLLSGAPLASGDEIQSGTSVDQLPAQKYGQSTKVPSLVLGCEKSNPSVHKNYSMLYSSHISWSSPTTPAPLELYPALAFDRLFKDEVRRGDKSILDAVLAHANRLRSRISTSDQRKLDEYLGSVRDDDG